MSRSASTSPPPPVFVAHPLCPPHLRAIVRRKRDGTSSNAKNGTWEMYWSVRSVGKRGSGVVAGQLGSTTDIHSHQLAPNPFIYQVHRKATSECKQAVGLALG